MKAVWNRYGKVEQPPEPVSEKPIADTKGSESSPDKHAVSSEDRIVSVFADLVLGLIVVAGLFCLLSLSFVESWDEKLRRGQQSMSAAESVVLLNLFDMTSYNEVIKGRQLVKHNPFRDYVLEYLADSRSTSPEDPTYFLCKDKDQKAMTRFFKKNRGELGIYLGVEREINKAIIKYCKY
ncbi:hypothetical protein [Neptuniibacter sp. QD37_11]|uniref:hypothetical protein n=1 Tax=Neptuniibacter sp. QD37_11 TaxID=3398209 RepID=UPI0039F62E81